MFEKAPELYDLFYEWKDYRAEASDIGVLVKRRNPEATSLLDVACGTGTHLLHLREAFDVAGIDIDPGLLKVASSKLPDVPLHRADMRNFELPRSFDVVTCLFSSIGYMLNAADLRQAIQTMGGHLSPTGLLIVEPWLSPDAFDPNRLGRTIVAKEPNREAVRMNGSRVGGTISTLDFHYLIATPGNVEHLVETHELGLFTDDEYRQAFEVAGLAVEHDPVGLMGRGLFIGTKS